MLRRCVYCGVWTIGRRACSAHADLLAVDPWCELEAECAELCGRMAAELEQLGEPFRQAQLYVLDPWSRRV